MKTRTYILLGLCIAALAGASFFLSRKDAIPVAQSQEVVEFKNGDSYTLTAGYVIKDVGGEPIRMLAYNGSIHGPLIKVPQNAEVTINFVNNMDQETALHSHGVRMENKFDGAPPITQEPIKPGQTFFYKLKFPDVGMYWYHPHVREDYQQDLGLYGNYLVVPADEKYWSPVNKEMPLFLDDILMENGTIVLINPDKADHTLMGRFGNVMLVNGETDYRLEVNKGDVVRFYLTNTANTRVMSFKMPGVRMKLVGGDSGKYEREVWQENVILAPSERAIVEVLFEGSGIFEMQNATPEGVTALGKVEVAETLTTSSYAREFEVLRTNVDTIASIDPFRSSFAKSPGKELSLTIDMMPARRSSGEGGGMGGHMMPDGSMMGGSMMSAPSPDGIEWEDANSMMNEMADEDSIQWKIVDVASKKENMAIDWKFKTGDEVKIKITNPSNSGHPMQHPIHFHGNRFLVLSTDGITNGNLVWKDTVLVPAGRSIEILLDASNPGDWMAHCHIAEHLSDGMMFAYTVE